MAKEKQTQEIGTKPFFAKCSNPDCGHCWPVAYLPMSMAKFAEIAGAAKFCPRCGASGAVVAKQHDGVLLEDGKPLRSSTHPGWLKFTPAQERMLIASDPDDVDGTEGTGVELRIGADYAVAKSLKRHDLGSFTGPGGTLPGMYWSNGNGLEARRAVLERAAAGKKP